MTNVRKISSLANADIASADVRDAVAALRWLGYKTVTGLHRIIEHCQTTPRRIRTLFCRDQIIAVTDSERRSLALSIAMLFDTIADECEAHAERCRKKGDELRIRERQQLLLPLGGDTWEYGASQAKAAA